MEYVFLTVAVILIFIALISSVEITYNPVDNKPDWMPSRHIRWQKRIECGCQQKVLQQWWIKSDGTAEWRDVPEETT